VQFRSLHSLARRTLVAGATSALALTLFHAVQPSLGTPHHPIGPGTIKDVAVTLVPTGAAAPGAAAPGAVDNAASSLPSPLGSPSGGLNPAPGW
jgi:hypothetical protein